MDRQVDSLQTSKKFKKTEIGEIPVDWEVMKIGELLGMEYGKGLIEEMREKGKFPVVGSNGIVGYHNRYCVKGPGIVIGRKGTIGAVTWVEPDFWPIDTTYYIELIRNDMSKRWLYYKLTSLNLEKLNMATGIPGLNRNIVYSSLIGIPSLEEQKIIAEILTNVDDAIKKSDMVIDKTKQLKKGLMQELLTRGIGHKKFKKTEIGEIPVDWQVVKLGNVASINMGQSPSSSNYFDYENGLPFFQGKTEFGDKYPSIGKWCNSPTKIAEKGDILISVRAPVGDINIAPARCCIGRGLAAIRGTQSDNIFLFFLMNYYKKTLAQVGQGGTFEAINRDVLYELLIPFPPLPEQKKIAEILTRVDEEIDKAVENREKMSTIKRGLMQVLLTGRVRVKV